MSALHKQPFPTHRVSRAAWIAGELRAQHAQLLAMIPAMSDAPAARLQAVWEAVAHRAIEIRCLCAELEGLES